MFGIGRKANKIEYRINYKIKELNNFEPFCMPEEINQYTDMIADYVENFIIDYATKKGYNPTGVIIDLIEESQEDLINAFNIPKYYASLSSNAETRNLHFKSNNNNYVRKTLLDIAMYKLVLRGGKTIGPERALMLAKIMPAADASIAMRYATYGTCVLMDERFARFVKEYLSLPNSSESIYWFRNYFDNTKNWDHQQELREIIDNFDYDVRAEVRGVSKKKGHL